jgi:hypothetical protein
MPVNQKARFLPAFRIVFDLFPDLRKDPERKANIQRTGQIQYSYKLEWDKGIRRTPVMTSIRSTVHQQASLLVLYSLSCTRALLAKGKCQHGAWVLPLSRKSVLKVHLSLDHF